MPPLVLLKHGNLTSLVELRTGPNDLNATLLSVSSLRIFGAVLIRPWLWATAIGAYVSFVPHRWWQRSPFLPIPDRTVMEWRVTTAYGHADMTLATSEVLSYLRWRRDQGR